MVENVWLKRSISCSNFNTYEGASTLGEHVAHHL